MTLKPVRKGGLTKKEHAEVRAFMTELLRSKEYADLAAKMEATTPVPFTSEREADLKAFGQRLSGFHQDLIQDLT